MWTLQPAKFYIYDAVGYKFYTSAWCQMWYEHALGHDRQIKENMEVAVSEKKIFLKM